MGRALKVVDEVPEPEPGVSVGAVSSAATSGSRRDVLVALRDEIASRIDEGVPARDLAALSLRLMAITDELETLEGEEDDVADAADAPDEPWTAS